MAPDRLLDGRVVAITGAASGIGRATLRLAAGRSAAGLVAVDRDGERLGEAADEARALGAAVVVLAADLTLPATAEEVVAMAVRRWGRLDAAVNAAGIEGGTLPLDRCADEDFDRVMDINLRALFRCVRSQLRQMYAQGSGAIVNVSSASVFGVHAHLGPYTISKAAVLTLSQVAAKEAGPRGVRVNAFCPGLTETPMLAESRRARAATGDIAARIPLGRTAEPREQAEAICWLCSDRSSFVNGAGLVSDGGRVG
jgi:NAD(P)-dependent dehydrogenase (short-subunit alcohol dehydrogenase family)